MNSEAYIEQMGGSSNPPEPIKLDRRTKWPADMKVPDKWIEDGYAIRKRHKFSRIRLSLEAERFVNWAVENGAKKIDWHRTWLNWCISPFCKGELEEEPLKPDVRLQCMAKLWAQGIRTQYINLIDVTRAVRLGLMTVEQARRLGFVVALD